MQKEYLSNPSTLLGRAVECIDNHGTDYLSKGTRYIVEDTFDDSHIGLIVYIYIPGFNKTNFNSKRFNVVDGPSVKFPAIGMKVRCIRTSGAEPNLKKDITYTVMSYCVQDDNNNFTYQLVEDPTAIGWNDSRFEIINMAPAIRKVIDANVDVEEERLRAIFLAPPPDCCPKCAAPKFACKYH